MCAKVYIWRLEGIVWELVLSSTMGSGGGLNSGLGLPGKHTYLPVLLSKALAPAQSFWQPLL